MSAYAEMLPPLQAEAQLAQIEAVSVPHMTAQGQRDVFRRHQDILRQHSRPARATKAGLAAAGIRVRHVPKKVKR